MTVGQVMVMSGICLIFAAVLLSVLGEVILHKRKKAVLREIDREYR